MEDGLNLQYFHVITHSFYNKVNNNKTCPGFIFLIRLCQLFRGNIIIIIITIMFLTTGVCGRSELSWRTPELLQRNTTQSFHLLKHPFTLSFLDFPLTVMSQASASLGNFLTERHQRGVNHDKKCNSRMLHIYQPSAERGDIHVHW